MTAPIMGQAQGALSRAATVVAEARTDLDALSRQLDGQVQGLQSRWAGRGGTAFLALHRAWMQKQGTITAALDGLEAALRGTEQDNTTTDEQQQALYSRFAGRL